MTLRLAPLLSLLFVGCGSGGKRPGGSDDTGPDDTGPDDTGTPLDDYGARWDCGGMDPADPAPLGGWVALTFDDGPSPDITPQVIEVLGRHEVPATFFYVGSMAADPEVDDLIADVAADPLFDIANHTWSHEDLVYRTASFARDEMEATNEILAEYGVVPKFFRFPYGDATCDAVDFARDLGMHVTGWHIDNGDWCYAMNDGYCSADDYWRIPYGYEEDMVGLTIDQILESDGGIVLMHDVWQYTADELETLILGLKDAGFRFTSLDDTGVFPRLNADDPYPFPWIGQSCPVSDDPCWQIENFSWCEPTGDPDAGADAGVCVLPCGSAPCFSRDGGPPSQCVNWEGSSVCLGVSDALNGWCEGVAGTVETEVSGVDVCVPYAWTTGDDGP